jgi:hypothetical protein
MADDSTGAGADPPAEILSRADVLKQYEIIVGHLRFEHTAFWTRFGFLLVAQTALLGFFSQALLEHLRTPRPHTLAAAAVFVVAGVVLAFFFSRIHAAADWWVDHWTALLCRIEGAAFGPLVLLRGVSPPGSSRQWAGRVFAVFIALWCAGAAVLAGAEVLRLGGG